MRYETLTFGEARLRTRVSSIFGVVLLVASSAVALDAEATQSPSTAPVPFASHSVLPDTDDVAMGEPFEWAPPKYPKQALKTRLQGSVVLMLSVDEDGYVTKGSVISGDPHLVEAALRAVQKWKYVPYDVNEQPVPVTTKVEFVFSMNQAGVPDVAVMFRHPAKIDVGPVFKVGKGVTAPKVIYSPDPRYSKKAKDEKYQGTCLLSVVVGPDGKTHDIKVSRFLGEDLDERAIEAVRNWKFEPALKDGKPVAVAIDVEVRFVLN